MNAAGAPREIPVRVPLGTFTRKAPKGGTVDVDFELTLVVTSTRLASLIAQAIANRDGRASVAGGGVVVLAKRVRAPGSPAEVSAPAPPGGSR